jgi:NAD(P)-dependent dehydrogenase (short-subunit alcohol dehydrogenase family)
MVILVTGAGKGTGRSVAEAFAAQGATVAANDVSPVNLDETVRHITTTGGKVKAYVEDIAKKMPVQALLNAVLDDFGQIDILVNCAEVEPQKSLLEMDDWDWQRTLDVNLNGAFLLTQSAGRIMREKGGGVIVHVGERAKGPEKRAAYSTSKAGLSALSALAAFELSGYGIRVYHVQPAGTGDVVRHILEICS